MQVSGLLVGAEILVLILFELFIDFSHISLSSRSADRIVTPGLSPVQEFQKPTSCSSAQETYEISADVVNLLQCCGSKIIFPDPV
jgi:hypothetical protein